jgi:hypothetical protein
MIVDDELAARSATEGAGMDGGDGTSQRAVIIRNPYEPTRRMHMRNLKNTHHLCIQTFKARGGAHLENTQDARRQIFSISPNWHFDAGELGMYMNDRIIEEVSRHMVSVNSAGPNLVKIKRVAGKISQFGLGAPFVAGSADQAATNSMVAQSVMVSANLHEKMLVKKGKVVLNSAQAGIPTVTSFDASVVKMNSNNTVNSWINCNNWELISKFRHATEIPAQTQAGNIYWEWIDEASDEAFQFYEQIAVTPVPVAAKVAIPKDVPLSLPKKSPFAVEVDMTESQGLICEWNEDCDWLISNPFNIIESVGFGATNVTVQVDHAQTLEIVAGSQEVTPVNNAIVQNNDSSFNFYQSHIGKNGNYVDTAPGKDTINQWQTLPTFSIHPIPPPTKATANSQHVLLPLVLETEIDFEIAFDTTYPLPAGILKDTAGIFQATGRPEFINFFKREQGTNKIHSSQTHAQKWGTNPMYFN